MNEYRRKKIITMHNCLAIGNMRSANYIEKLRAVLYENQFTFHCNFIEAQQNNA